VGLSQQEGILRRKFSYAGDVSQAHDSPKRAIGRRTMEYGCLSHAHDGTVCWSEENKQENSGADMN
jgi:hypothetical protein